MKKIALTALLPIWLILALFCWNTSLHAATLEACGYHDLSLVMEQLPADWDPWYTRNNDSMWLWNQYMDIYRYVDDDGTWGKNGENEFGGWPSDADLFNQWGFHWNGFLAYTVWSWGCECCRITESDVVFNPAYAWTADRDYAEDNPDSVIYYDSVLLHEMRHNWGMQTRNEDYDYAHPTVMHSYIRRSVQDRMTIHYPEAYLIRRQYDDQTSVITRRNMVVVSKYADHTWKNATTDKTNYYAGDNISVYDITVENVGTEDLSNVHIRLYLSTNRIISTGDTQIGDWYWTSFPAEAYGVYDFTGMTIPLDLPAGTYYVGALMTVNGYASDDLSYDNTTHLWGTINVSQRSITVTSPNGGETWFVGDSRNITWTSENAGANVKIEISRDGGSTWSTITSSTPNDGSYAWTVTTPASTACRIRITSTSYPAVSDTSNANFTIREAATGTIYGTVRDRTTGNPINRAKVIARHEDGITIKRTKTDASGSYEYTGLKAGLWKLKAKKRGYRKKGGKVDVEPGGTYKKNFRLRPR